MKRKKKFKLLDYRDSLEYFKFISAKTNEYYLKRGVIPSCKIKIPLGTINTLEAEELVVETKDLGNDRGRTIVKPFAVERFHPNNIDNKDFWIELRELFPKLSMCNNESRSVKEVNEKTFGTSLAFGLYSFIDKLIDDSKEQLNFLEIGFGYGNIFFKIKDRCKYFGIDYIIPKSLKKYKNNFIEIDKSGIPDFLVDSNFMDIIYCVNTFQHCSQKDRFDYLEQSYSTLKSGGYLIFTEFMMTEKNKNDDCWGILDENGRAYTQFFNQLTECDWDYELHNKLHEIGFKPINGNICGNFMSLIVQK